MKTKMTLRLKGGKGSGNFGHKGRKGMVGGSSASGASGKAMEQERIAINKYMSLPMSKDMSPYIKPGASARIDKAATRADKVQQAKLENYYAVIRRSLSDPSWARNKNQPNDRESILQREIFNFGIHAVVRAIGYDGNLPTIGSTLPVNYYKRFGTYINDRWDSNVKDM